MKNVNIIRNGKIIKTINIDKSEPSANGGSPIKFNIGNNRILELIKKDMPLTVEERQGLEGEISNDRLFTSGIVQEYTADGKVISQESSTVKNLVGAESPQIQHKLSILKRDKELKEEVSKHRDQLYSELKKLENEIKDYVPTEKEEGFREKTANPNDFERAVQKITYLETKLKPKVQMYKKLSRLLEPDNPLAGSIYRLRENRRVWDEEHKNRKR